MKSFSHLLFVLLLASNAIAQTGTDPEIPKPLVIEDITKAMSKGEQPGFKIDIFEAKKKGVVDALTKTMKEEAKSKLELVNNEYHIPGGVIKSISPDTLNVYFIVNEYEDRAELLVFYEKDSVFLTKEKNETEFLSARKFTRDFAVKAYKNAVTERIDLENKKLKELESQLEQLYKGNDKLQKKISEEKQNIDNTKEKIATSELDQERMRGQVQDQKAKVTQAKSGGNETVLKEEEKKLKGFEGEASKLMKQEDGFHKDVTKSEANIRQYEREITDNESAANLKQEDVTKQKDLINKLQKKLEAIQ